MSRSDGLDLPSKRRGNRTEGDPVSDLVTATVPAELRRHRVPPSKIGPCEGQLELDFEEERDD